MSTHGYLLGLFWSCTWGPGRGRGRHGTRSHFPTSGKPLATSPLLARGVMAAILFASATFHRLFRNFLERSWPSTQSTISGRTSSSTQGSTPSRSFPQNPSCSRCLLLHREVTFKLRWKPRPKGPHTRWCPGEGLPSFMFQ